MPDFAADTRYAAFRTEVAPVQPVAAHIDKVAAPPPTPGMEEVEPRLEQRPRISLPREPPAWDDTAIEAVPDWDALAQPQPEYVFDQQAPW